MAITAAAISRLKSQLLSSGLQQQNQALYQVIHQLIDAVKETVSDVNELTGSSGGGGGSVLGQSFITLNNDQATLNNSRRIIAGTGINFNIDGERLVINTAAPLAMDGIDGEDGLIGPIGPQGIQGPAGLIGPMGINDDIAGYDIGLPFGNQLNGLFLSSGAAAPSETTVTTTGNIDDLNFGNASLIRMNNASDATIRGLLAGLPGQVVIIISVGAANVYFAHENAGSSAANRLFNTITSGNTPLAAGKGTAIYQYDNTSDRWRLIVHEQGRWINVPHAAGNFTASAGTWTVDAGDQITYSYFLKGNSLTVGFTIQNTSVSSTPATLQITLPNGWSASIDTKTVTMGQDNAAAQVPNVARVAGGTLIYLYPTVAAATNWSVATNTTGVQGTIIFPLT